MNNSYWWNSTISNINYLILNNAIVLLYYTIAFNKYSNYFNLIFQTTTELGNIYIEYGRK